MIELSWPNLTILTVSFCVQVIALALLLTRSDDDSASVTVHFAVITAVLVSISTTWCLVVCFGRMGWTSLVPVAVVVTILLFRHSWDVFAPTMRTVLMVSGTAAVALALTARPWTAEKKPRQSDVAPARISSLTRLSPRRVRRRTG